MKEEDKTKEQPINKLAALRQRVAEFETLESERKRAEEELKNSEQRFRSIFDCVTVGILLADTETKAFHTGNKMICQMLGYSLEEIKNLGVMDIHPKEDLPYVIEQFEKQARGEIALARDVLVKRKDGSVFYADINSAPITLAGRPYLAGTFRDITERKQAEETLQKSEGKYRSLINNVKLGIFRSTPGATGRFLEVNPAMKEITGYSRKELLQMNVADLYVHPEERESVLEAIASARGKTTKELRFRKKDGTEITISDTKVAVRDDAGKIIYFDGIIEDISERKQAEERVLGQSAVLEAINRVFRETLTCETEEEVARTCLAVAEELTGSKFGFVGEVNQAGRFDAIALNDPGWDACRIPKSNAVVMIKDMEIRGIWGRALKDGKSLIVNDPSSHPDRVGTPEGHPALTSFLSVPLKRAGRTIGMIALANKESGYDLTNQQAVETLSVAFVEALMRKRAEERERRLQQELYLSSRLASIGQLAAGVAHEINNPLTGILGFSQRLLRKSIDDEVKRDLERIHSEALRAAQVVKNLLTFARRREPKKEYSDINDIVQKTLELRAYELKANNIEVVTDLAPSLPKTMANFYQIQEVFLDIILNAEQAVTETKGKGKLSIKTQEIEGYIRISFTDNGPGIPAENLGKLFDPFFTTKGEGGGTGLGLSVCHGILIEHGGRIYVESKPGKGATFFVELPLATKKD